MLFKKEFQQTILDWLIDLIDFKFVYFSNNNIKWGEISNNNNNNNLCVSQCVNVWLSAYISIFVSLFFISKK